MHGAFWSNPLFIETKSSDLRAVVFEKTIKKDQKKGSNIAPHFSKAVDRGEGSSKKRL